MGNPLRKPRIAILAPLKEWGGIERKMLILCREFLAREVDVDYLLTRGGRVPYPDEFPGQVTVVDLETRGKLDAIPKLIRHVRANRPDAILTAKDHAAKVAILARVLGRFDARVYVKVTNTLSQTLRRPLKRHAARWLYRYADGIIAISHGVKDDLVDKFRMPEKKIHVIYNPMVTPDIPLRAAKSPDHPWLQAGEQPVFLGAGRLTPQKDFRLLVDAFARVRRHRLCRLIILGEGPERVAIERHADALGIRSDVCLPGYVADPVPWMARAAVFVLSSRYEGLGNVLVEALAAGAPVVSTDCPSGPAEILLNGQVGPLSPIGDADQLAANMCAMLERPPPAALLAQASERFRSGRIADQYLRVMGVQR